MTEPTLGELKARIRKFRDDRDWRQFHTLKDLATAIALEAAELQEVFLWQDTASEPELASQRRNEIEAELADIFIQVMNFAIAADVDLARAVEQKLDANAAKYPVHKARGQSTKYTEL